MLGIDGQARFHSSNPGAPRVGTLGEPVAIAPNVSKLTIHRKHRIALTRSGAMKIGGVIDEDSDVRLLHREVAVPVLRKANPPNPHSLGLM